MSDPLATISTRHTPQTEQADTRQVANAGGGYSFTVDALTRLRRFLVLGSAGGTFYASERDHTKENAEIVLDLARTRTSEVVAAVVEISTSGRAPKQNPALFALAAAAKLGDNEGRKAALAAVPLVARTGTHLFILAGYLEQFGGWGRGTRRAIANWYLDKPVRDVAYQVGKYRQREGWTHADLLRLSHPKPVDADPEAVQKRHLFDWIHGRGSTGDSVINYAGGLELLEAFDTLQRSDLSVREVVNLIGEGRGVSWEMIPDRFINILDVWMALLEQGLPHTALMRQLPRLTRLGLLSPLGSLTKSVADQLADPERLKKARVHPINVLVAQRTYASGQSARGDGTWTPSRPIVDALDAAFYAAYGAIEPTGKRLMLSLDVSASMSWNPIANMPITPREASAALALVTANVEPMYELNAFSGELVPLSISPRQRLGDAIRAVSDLPASHTDCAQPMLHALRNDLAVDTFVIYTDNETNARSMHPHQALQQYRRQTGIDARLVVVAMQSNGFTIAVPNDPGMLDIAGFDSAVPGLIGDFARGL